jgi:Immunity protein 42
MLPHGYARRVGNRRLFAVEFEFDAGASPKVWNEWFGSLWLWIDGHLVGNPLESEMISIGLESLKEAATETGTRRRELLSTNDPNEALDLIMWARYGDESSPKGKLVEDEHSLFPFEILPRRTGPFFDGWEAILIEEDDVERFIYRQRETPVTEVPWPLGTLREVVFEACAEFEAMARQDAHS